MPQILVDTSSGRVIDLLELKPEQIEFESIAHSLSQQCRFAGHTRKFYSVAEHCYNLSIVVAGAEKLEQPDLSLAVLAILVHDAAEAYIGDIITPVKQSAPIIMRVEDKIMETVWQRLGINGGNMQGLIKKYDKIALASEMWALLPDRGRTTMGITQKMTSRLLVDMIDAAPERTPEEGRSLWLSEFAALVEECKIGL